jgi:hypothetical protein
MALNELKLKNDFESIFDFEKSTSNGFSQIAHDITNVVVSYLSNVNLGPIKLPGVNPIPIPKPDLFFSSQLMQPIISVKKSAEIIKSAIEEDLNINYNSNIAGSWTASNEAFIKYVNVTFVSFNAPNGYITNGTIIPGPISLSSVFNSLKDNKNEITFNLANHLHNFFTNCTFTGFYLKGSEDVINAIMDSTSTISLADLSTILKKETERNKEYFIGLSPHIAKLI